MADSSPSSIPFQSPTTGAIQNVTSDQWDAALSAGYKPTDHTLMYSPGGQRGMVPNEQLRDYVNQGYVFDQNTQQMNQAARQGGATPKAAKPATDPVMKASQQYAQTLDPQQRYLYNLPADQRPAAEQKMESGSSMAIPSFLAGVGTLGPIEAVGKQGLVQGAKTVGLRFLRPLIGSAVGSEAGERIGRPIGRMLGDEQAGETVGRYAGGAFGAGALSSPAKLSEVPFLGRFLTTDQEYADLQAARTLARQQAMERAVANSPEAQQRALGAFMNKGYQPAELAEAAGQDAAEAAATKKGLSPLIYRDEAHYNQVQAMNQRLADEASKAGTYSAARGSTKKPLNYQQRIGRKLPWMP